MRGHPSIEHSWPTRDSLRHIGPCAESMPLAASKDMHWYFHFVDDWEEDANINWEDVYLDEDVEASATAKHSVQFGMVEDAFNKRWKEFVTHGLHTTFYARRVAVLVIWYLQQMIKYQYENELTLRGPQLGAHTKYQRKRSKIKEKPGG